jgi:CRP-like cAMP-binding protein/Fe-S-cluster-containing hydrogenase component 2
MKTMYTLETMTGFLEKAPFFEGASRKAMEGLVMKSGIISVTAGETIIREGEYELVCYIILSGKFDIEVTDEETGDRRLVRTVGAGELLGEMSVLSGNPRFAEATCVEEAQVLKITRDGLLAFMDAAPSVKSRIDADYRKRILSSSLRKINVFSLVDDLSLAALAESVEMATFQKGEVVFASGDLADAFYLIRDGFVKMSRSLDENESAFFDARFDKAYSKPMREGTARSFIMAYLGKGAYFGERALFDKRQRIATAEAVTRVDAVRIKKEGFDDLMRRHPLVAEKLKEEAAARYSNETQVKNQSSQDMLSWIGRHDILGTDSMLIMDLDKCVRCLRCVEVCSELHGGISRITHNGVRFKNILIPTSCRRCREPTCMIGCPTGAIQRDINGEVFHTDACIGCGNCARRCPFGNISIVETAGRGTKKAGLPGVAQRLMEGFAPDGLGAATSGKKTRRAVKCDMCKDYERMGCKHNCPTGAILTVTPSEYFARLARRMGRDD